MVENLNQQGYVIRQKNSIYNYLVVEEPATTRTVRAAEVQAGAATRQAVRRDDSLTASSAASISKSRQRGESRSVANSSPPPKPAVAALKAINTARARLSDMAGISAVQHNPQVRLFGRSGISNHRHQTTRDGRNRRRLNTASSCPDDTFERYAAVFDYPDLVIGRSSEQAPYGISMVQANFSVMEDISSTYKNKVLFCVIDDGMDPSNPEFSAGGCNSCSAGHAAPMPCISSIHPTCPLAVTTTYQQRCVLLCHMLVLPSARLVYLPNRAIFPCDMARLSKLNHLDLLCFAASTSGCTPGTVRPITGTVHNCSFAWDEPGGSHGTHTSGIIAAQHTGTDHGIVGMSGGGAQLYQ